MSQADLHDDTGFDPVARCRCTAEEHVALVRARPGLLIVRIGDVSLAVPRVKMVLGCRYELAEGAT